MQIQFNPLVLFLIVLGMVSTYECACCPCTLHNTFLKVLEYFIFRTIVFNLLILLLESFVIQVDQQDILLHVALLFVPKFVICVVAGLQYLCDL